jgi:ribonuclease VapC
MIVDSSAVIAIIRDEHGAANVVRSLHKANKKFIATPTYLETCMVAVSDRVAMTLTDVEETLAHYGIVQIAFTSSASAVAVAAFLRYGKGRGHPAQLNFGDCISYAVSKVEMMPLLFTGDDFRKTDVECAI